jgi:hypothetical protein
MSDVRRPNFLIVCDHGIPADHSDCEHSVGCGKVDRVALLPWFPERPGWWPAEGIDEHASFIWPMEGDQRGRDPKWLVSGWTTPDEPDLRRDAIELVCPEKRCSRRPYRSDVDKLQTLLMQFASSAALRAAFTLWADDSLIVVVLDELHEVRVAAQTRGLQV